MCAKFQKDFGIKFTLGNWVLQTQNNLNTCKNKNLLNKEFNTAYHNQLIMGDILPHIITLGDLYFPHSLNGWEIKHITSTCV